MNHSVPAEMSSTSKISVAFGGTAGGTPRLPYPSSGGMVMRRTPPGFMPTTPRSKPLMTWFAPSLN